MLDRDPGVPTVSVPPIRGTDGSLFRVLVGYSRDPALVLVPRVIGERPLVVGRGQGGQTPGALALPDPRASRAHAQFELRGGRLHVRDLGSRNGTFVGGARIEGEAVLADQDVVRVGDHVFVVQTLVGEDIQRLIEAPPRLEGIVGDGRASRALRAQVVTAAPGVLPVLLRGETGTGKELVAAEIHRRSARAGRFVPVNCAAIPAEVAEAELFGHVRGAFTGAVGESPGLFGAADKGTILLDEIGEMPISLQPKLLRALATGEVRRVGDTTARRVDVRVVAATHVALEASVEARTFREDLLARVSGHVIALPPLRARRDDLLVLAAHFLGLALPGRSESSAPEAIAALMGPDAAEALLVHDWPHNVRGLELTLRAAATRMERGAQLSLEHLPPSFSSASRAPTADRRDAPSAFGILEVRPDVAPSADELRAVVEHFDGNVSRVAAFFGKERRQIYRWADRLEIDLGAARDE